MRAALVCFWKDITSDPRHADTRYAIRRQPRISYVTTGSVLAHAFTSLTLVLYPHRIRAVLHRPTRRGR
jgi:hypothetical protein